MFCSNLQCRVAFNFPFVMNVHSRGSQPTNETMNPTTFTIATCRFKRHSHMTGCAYHTTTLGRQAIPSTIASSLTTKLWKETLTPNTHKGPLRRERNTQSRGSVASYRSVVWQCRFSDDPYTAEHSEVHSPTLILHSPFRTSWCVAKSSKKRPNSVASFDLQSTKKCVSLTMKRSRLCCGHIEVMGVQGTLITSRSVSQKQLICDHESSITFNWTIDSFLYFCQRAESHWSPSGTKSNTFSSMLADHWRYWKHTSWHFRSASLQNCNRYWRLRFSVAALADNDAYSHVDAPPINHLGNWNWSMIRRNSLLD